jgi:hypothetical protein
VAAERFHERGFARAIAADHSPVLVREELPVGIRKDEALLQAEGDAFQGEDGEWGH